MKSLLWAILGVTICSFVLFYGWGELGQTQGVYENPYGQVVVRLEGGRGEYEVSPAKLDWVRGSVLNSMQYRALFLGRQLRNFQSWINFVDNNLNPLFLLYRLADFHALYALARQYELVVPKSELNQAVARRVEGLSRSQLQSYLSRQGMTERDFIQRIEYEILIGQAESMISNTTHASLYELWLEYLLAEEEITVAYVSVPVYREVQNVSPSDDEILAFFNENKEDFRLPDRVKLSYILVGPSDFLEEMQDEVAEEELRNLYEERKETYKDPKEVEGRHIAIHYGGETGRTQAEATKIARDLRTMLSFGYDFTEMANRFSDDPDNFRVLSNQPLSPIGKGGELASPVTELSVLHGEVYKDTVLSLEAGEISQPFASTYGPPRAATTAVFIFKAEEVIPSSYRPFEGVEPTLRREIARTLAEDKVAELTREMEEGIDDIKTLEDIAGDTGLEIQESPWVPLDRSLSAVRGIGNLSEYRELIRRVWVEDGLSPVISLGTGRHLLFEVSDFQAEHEPMSIDDLETSATVVNELRYRRAKEISLEKANELLTKIEMKDAESTAAAEEIDAPEGEEAAPEEEETPSMRDAFFAAAEEMELQPQESTFKRQQIPPMLNVVPQFAKRSLGVPEGHIGIDLAPNEDRPTNAVVWQIIERTEPSLEDFAAEMPTLERGYLINKADAMVEEYVADLRRKGLIEVKPGPQFIR